MCQQACQQGHHKNRHRLVRHFSDRNHAMQVSQSRAEKTEANDVRPHGPPDQIGGESDHKGTDNRLGCIAVNGKKNQQDEQ